MSIPFNPTPPATTAFRQLFNDWRVTPLQPLDGGGDVHVTWERGSEDFHVTTRLPGNVPLRDDFKI